MITTMTALVPSAASWTGNLAARPADLQAPCPAARLRALPPVGAVAPEVFGIAPTAGRPDGTAVPSVPVAAQFGTREQSYTQHDTTPGIHSPRRPLS
ncbi:hypothetical protein [Geodermatophilus marinus]|uniref:hypothetical protein n=1 Tax=Geodermatophilus sp. LHW52908 TaxID=2303986 RepID=UPI000E3CB60E|nr:hypothetical protein [Geodermatophilus sp. LHW52908]RFU21827.1 hypothetical protein D0Z06_09360 [Geodermatophilus sp. LHW52908]